MSPDPPRAADILLRPPAPRARLHWPRSPASPAGGPRPGLVVLFTPPCDGGLAGPLARALDALVLATAAAHVVEAYAALAWAADHAVEIGADPARVAVVGHGPGAALAERVAALAAGEGWPPLRAVVTIRPGEPVAADAVAAALKVRWAG
jgi:hypothetical protein